MIQGGKVKPANKRFSNLDSDYEITFDESTTVVEAKGGSSLPQQKVSPPPSHLTPAASIPRQRW
jgi:hypothetical protein